MCILYNFSITIIRDSPFSLFSQDPPPPLARGRTQPQERGLGLVPQAHSPAWSFEAPPRGPTWWAGPAISQLPRAHKVTQQAPENSPRGAPTRLSAPASHWQTTFGPRALDHLHPLTKNVRSKTSFSIFSATKWMLRKNYHH